MKPGLFYDIIRYILIFFLKIICRYEVHGLENIPEHGKLILCPNHISNLDAPLLIAAQKRKINFMGKSELFKNKFLSKIFTKMGVFPVNRGKGDTQAINTAIQVLEEDLILGIFIEGTRSKTGELLRPKSGAALIAFNTNSPVLPVCITTTNGKGLKIFKKVIISYAKPLSIKELGLTKGGAHEFRNATRLIMDRISDMKQYYIKS